jgi:uncharacterized membrane-anchored protein YjiN (DUF445 family)
LAELPRIDPAPTEALTRARRLATGVLLSLVATFLATHLIGAETWPLQLVQRMAEAGMVGGLADWFAVEALFRRPLGLPIPHTALLPANQARAAKNLGRFFEAHFLDPAQLEDRLRRVEISRHAADWLGRPDNALALAERATSLFGGIIRADPPPRVLARVRAWLRAEAQGSGADAAIARGVGELVKAGLSSGVVDELIGLLRHAVDENRAAAVEMVHDRSRWWIARPVDRRVAGLAVDGVLSLLDELRAPDSGLRREFDTAIGGLVDRLADDGALERAVSSARTELVRGGTIDALALRLAATVRDRIAARLDDDPDAVAQPLAAMLAAFAARLKADPEARATLDATLAAGAARVIGDLRPVLGGYVADVIAGWQPEELIARFEAQIGPDLQFIRINGALLGALIGGLLYGLGVLLD